MKRLLETSTTSTTLALVRYKGESCAMAITFTVNDTETDAHKTRSEVFGEKVTIVDHPPSRHHRDRLSYSGHVALRPSVIPKKLGRTARLSSGVGTSVQQLVCDRRVSAVYSAATCGLRRVGQVAYSPPASPQNRSHRSPGRCYPLRSYTPRRGICQRRRGRLYRYGIGRFNDVFASEDPAHATWRHP